MSTQHKNLIKMKKQQEKCNSSLAVSKKNSNRIVPNSAPSNKASPSCTIKFSSDIEKFQLIYNISKAPEAAQIKRVIDLLCETRRALTPEQIYEGCYVNLMLNKAIFDALKRNPKVKYDGMKFSYKPKYDLENKDQLLLCMKKFPDGIAVVDLMDAYPSALEDLKSLKAAGQVWILSSSKSDEGIAYLNDIRGGIMVDDDLKELFHSIELPKEMTDIEKYLQKIGTPAKTDTRRRDMELAHQNFALEPKIKKGRKGRKMRRLTNSHLPELFSILHT